MRKAKQRTGDSRKAGSTGSEGPPHPTSDDRTSLIAAIRLLASGQAQELLVQLAVEHHVRGTSGVPNAMQLQYADTSMYFAYGAEVALALNVDGTEQLLTGDALIGALASDSRISLPARPSSSHFTFIRGGEVSLDDVLIPRPMRALLAWDLHHVLSFVAFSKEPLPYPHSVANTFQELLVKFFIERLGVNRGPQDRRDHLLGAQREAKQIAGGDYMDELSVATTDLTANEKFWQGITLLQRWGHGMCDQLLLTIIEVAAKLRLGRSLTYRLIQTGELRSVSIGRSRRVLASDLEEFVRRLSDGVEE